MTKEVVHSVRESTPEAAEREMDGTPAGCALVELRADDLRAGDVAGLVRRAVRPVVCTVRAKGHGGSFDGSVAEKRAILGGALRAGAAFIDVEWDGPLRELAFEECSSRTIVSHHGASCESGELEKLFAAMSQSRAERLKIVPVATRLKDALAVRDLLIRARGAGRALCAFASGPAGTWSRALALCWGSWGTYGCVERGKETGGGQPESRELLDVFRVQEITEATTVFGLCGTPIGGSPTPSIHAAGYRELGLDAVYLPLETDDLEDVAAIVGDAAPLAFAGLGVTIPLKEPAAARCKTLDPHASCGSANTVKIRGQEWDGFNTDAPAALALVRRVLDPAGCRVAIVGAGGTARAIAAGLVDAGAAVTLFNRDAGRARRTAAAAGASGASLSELATAAWDLLVQATPLGREGEEFLPRRYLNGRMVLDAAYAAEATPLVRAARARGLAVADGLDLLEEQAALQFELLTGRGAPREAMSAALSVWRA